MLSHLQARRTPETLQREIIRADAVTADLASAVLDLALTRRALPDVSPQANRMRELIGAQAWTDTALALVALDHSRVLRQLTYDSGEWHCTLGALWPVPAWLDDTVEFTHPELPLAILGALARALQEKSAPASAATSVPQSRTKLRDVVEYLECDNFA